MNEDKLQKLVESSGFIPHKKAIDVLRNDGWKLLISPYYYDNISNSVKEIDLIAEKQFTSDAQWSGSSVQINVQLFIECKYIKQEILLWFDSKDLNRAVSKVEQNTGLRVLHNRGRADIVRDELHYLSSNQVAKLFSSNAHNEDVIYKAVTQSLNAQLYYDQSNNNPLFFDFFSHKEVATMTLRYPIIICDNFANLKEIKFEENDADKYKVSNIDGHFQIETNYTFLDIEKKARTEYFLIDLLNVSDMKNYLDKLSIEVRKIMSAVDMKRY